jgi:hypothetical protein
MSNRRTGKVARLPKEMRDVVNLMLRDGASYGKIVEKLIGMGQRGFNEQNLTAWYQGGYKDWEAEQQRLDEMKANREFALDIVKQNEGSKIHEAGMQIAATQLYELLSGFDISGLKALLKESPENYAVVVNALTKLSKGALDIEKFKENVAEQKRKIETELGKVKTDGGLTPETITKIEEALNLL